MHNILMARQTLFTWPHATEYKFYPHLHIFALNHYGTNLQASYAHFEHSNN